MENVKAAGLFFQELFSSSAFENYDALAKSADVESRSSSPRPALLALSQDKKVSPESVLRLEEVLEEVRIDNDFKGAA